MYCGEAKKIDLTLGLLGYSEEIALKKLCIFSFVYSMIIG